MTSRKSENCTDPLALIVKRYLVKFKEIVSIESWKDAWQRIKEKLVVRKEKMDSLMKLGVWNKSWMISFWWLESEKVLSNDRTLDFFLATHENLVGWEGIFGK